MWSVFNYLHYLSSFLICNHSLGLSERAAFRNSVFNATKKTAGSSLVKRPKAEFKSSSLTKKPTTFDPQQINPPEGLKYLPTGKTFALAIQIY